MWVGVIQYGIWHGSVEMRGDRRKVNEVGEEEEWGTPISAENVLTCNIDLVV